MFNRVLVANRGEIAVRVIRALHELGAEAVAVYSTADADALHVKLADRAVRLGPPPAAESYLNIPSLVAAASTTGCEAVHPGYGFLAENAEFVRMCEANDLVFVGPTARQARSAAASIASRSSGVSADEGVSSISFWWRRWIEHSRSPSVSTVPWPSQRTWISTWRAGTSTFST